MNCFLEQIESKDKKTYVCPHCRCQEIFLSDNFADKRKNQNDEVIGIMNESLKEFKDDIESGSKSSGCSEQTDETFDNIEQIT
jgi:hypothetical protein